MKEEYVDELDDTLDDVEPVVDNPAELYEHFRVVVDKGQSQVRVDKYLFERLVLAISLTPPAGCCRWCPAWSRAYPRSHNRGLPER